MIGEALISRVDQHRYLDVKGSAVLCCAMLGVCRFRDIPDPQHHRTDGRTSYCGGLHSARRFWR